MGGKLRTGKNSCRDVVGWGFTGFADVVITGWSDVSDNECNDDLSHVIVAIVMLDIHVPNVMLRRLVILMRLRIVVRLRRFRFIKERVELSMHRMHLLLCWVLWLRLQRKWVKHVKHWLEFVNILAI